ncbi:uncharacterized protein NECHADRAFT_55017, partial [Fusarium vanettenii 77-13-4]
IISIGSYINSGGYYYYSYSIIRGYNKIIPVDIYILSYPLISKALIYSIF